MEAIDFSIRNPYLIRRKPYTRVKSESSADIDLSSPIKVFATKTCITTEGGKETIEILSSDDERMSDDEDALGSGDHSIKVVDAPSIPVPTRWLDPNIVSRVVEERTKITTQFIADRVEYISELPPVWPIFRQPTAVVLDISDAKFDIVDKKGKRLRVDALIRDKVSVSLLPRRTLIPTSL
jgi:hypothetical protein